LKQIKKTGDTKRVIGEGMPKFKDPIHRGNLWITFEVQFPLFLQINDVERLRQVLPGSRPAPEITEDTEEAELSVPTTRPNLQRFGLKESETERDENGEDDEGEQRGARFHRFFNHGGVHTGGGEEDDIDEDEDGEGDDPRMHGGSGCQFQ
jgi:DnaJ-class molecular chaperone